jgi:hypothetical protein
MSIQTNFPAIKPTLLLDFANTKALDSRVTFTRASTATFYGTQTAKAEENLLLQSQAWATTPWFVNIGGSVTAVNNSAAAPNGTTTATSLTFSAQFGSQAQSVTTIAGLNYTFSFWARRISGNTALHINHFDSATGANTAFTITDNWAQYSVTVLGRTGGGAVQFGVQDRNASGFGQILVWGAQLEQRSAVTAYTATTTQPITNYIPVLQTAASGVARFDHNPTTFESLGLEIEEQRTNLLTYSEQFGNAAWTKSASSITANTIVAPDGAVTGDKLVEDATNAAHFVRQNFTSTVGVTYVSSVYLKAAERTSVLVIHYDGSVFAGVSVNLSTGVLSAPPVATGLTDASATSTITSVGNGWYRVSVSRAQVSTTITQLRVTLQNGSNEVYTGNGFNGLYIWGAQLEAGAFPTSYIQTVASQVTRAADAASMTGTNFSSWYNQAEGTMYAEYIYSSGVVGNAQCMYSISDGGETNRLVAFRTSTPSQQFDETGGGGSIVTGAALANTAYKSALAYKVNDMAVSINGAATVADTSVTISAKTQLAIGDRATGGRSLNGTISKLAYYPLRVSNANLQALTS